MKIVCTILFDDEGSKASVVQRFAEIQMAHTSEREKMITFLFEMNGTDCVCRRKTRKSSRVRWLELQIQPYSVVVVMKYERERSWMIFSP